MGDVSCARRTFVKAVPAIGAAVTATTVWGHPLHAVADEGTKGKIVEPEMNELEFDFVCDGVKTKKVEVERDGLVLRGTLEVPACVPETSVPMVLLLHGARGNRRSDLYDNVCRSLAARGYAMMRFDFDGHGDSDGEFDDSTVLTELADMDAIVAYAQSFPWVERLFVFGHSQGGCVASMYAGQNPDVFDGIVTVDAAVNIRDNCESGSLDGKASAAYVEAGKTLEIFETAANYDGPALVIHGLADTVALPEYSERLHESLENSSLYLIAGAAHTPASHLDEIVCLTDLFYRRCMR